MVWELEVRRLLGRIRGKLEANMKIDVKEMGWDVAWSGLIWLVMTSRWRFVV